MAIHVIDAALEIIAAEINNYLLSTQGSGLVVPNNFLSQSGSLNSGLDGKIVLTLVNIEEDRLSRPLTTSRKLPNGSTESIKPEVRLNLYLLFIANPSASNTNADGSAFLNSVGNLSKVIGFFQAKNFFDHENTPGLHAKIEKLWVELYPMTFEQQNHLWGSLGAKYQPSILYKVRLVKIQEEEVSGSGALINQYTITGKGLSG